MSALMQTYARLPVQFVRGEGAWLWSDSGQRYLDALSGIAVCNLGHAHPAVTEAICEQAGQLVHTSNFYGIDPQERLGKKLCQLSALDAVFFCNSGAEANEAAIKIARRHGHHRGDKTPKIVVFDNAFHGRTMATLSATANPRAKEGFGPMLEGFVRAPYGDAEAVARLADEHDDIAAVLVEPVQGEGGVQVPPAGFLKALRELCDQRGWLLMLDEIQTGIARTGQWLACQHETVLPDVLTLAKALGNGVPIGACLARQGAADLLQPGSHGTTFGGNPLACRAALAVLDSIEKEGLVEQAKTTGAHMLERLNHELGGLPGVSEVRGKGMMIGIELNKPCAELVARALEEKHLLINVTAGNTVRLLPPVIIDQAQADAIVDGVVDLIHSFLNS
ncbi:MAG: acetylornithine transaminase [Pseudomonadota bacterium]